MDAALVGFCQKPETWCANPLSNNKQIPTWKGGVLMSFGP